MKYRIVRTIDGVLRVIDVDDLLAWAKGADVQVIGEHRSPKTRAELQGKPRLAGYAGPTWDGDAIRYEDLAIWETVL